MGLVHAFGSAVGKCGKVLPVALRVWPVLLSSSAAIAGEPASRPAITDSTPVVGSGAPLGPRDPSADPMLLYRREIRTNPASDLVRLKNGRIVQGKALEWGTNVIIYDVGGRATVVNAGEVDRLEPRPSDVDGVKPPKPDLTVTFIERLPRQASWHGRVNYDIAGKEGLGVLELDPGKYPASPAAGDNVTFIVHVKNVGASVARPCDWRATMDQQPLQTGKLDKPLDAGAETTFELAWKWQDGQHVIRIELDTASVNDEITRWNNRFTDYTRAQTFHMAVSRNTMEAFSRCRNLVDTFSFEDWVQYHIRCMNRLFADSVYPSAPEGILERVRIDNIVVVENARDDASRAGWESGRHIGNDPKAPEEYGGRWDFPPVRDDAHAAEWAGRMDWGLPHELGHQLGLIDIYQYNSEINQCLVRDAQQRYVQRRHFFPWPRTMMHWHGPHLFSEVCAGYLNKTLGRPRGFFGDYQYAVPKRCVLEIRGPDGMPVEGVSVAIYQRHGTRDPKLGMIVDDKLVVGTTGADGRFPLPNRKAPAHETVNGYKLTDNPFGRIDVVGMNGLLLVRLFTETWDEWHFVRLFDFNVACLRGMTDEFVLPIATQFAPPGGPERIEYTELFYDRDMPAGTARFCWPHWNGGKQKIREYRVLQRCGNAGDDSQSLTLVDVVKPNPPDTPEAPGQPHESRVRIQRDFTSGGTHGQGAAFTVAAVNTDGKPAVPAAPLAAPPFKEMLRGVLNNALLYYVPVVGDDDCPIYTCSASDYPPGKNFKPFGVRVLNAEHQGYRPSAAGLALDADGLLIAADARHHQVAWYDRGDLVRLVGDKRHNAESAGSGAGQFNQPSDVAVDSKGRVYVADRMNHRLVILDRTGAWQGTFGARGDGTDQFNEPFALSCLRDKLAVTEHGNKRVSVYDVSGDVPVLQFAAARLNDPDRAVVTQSGLAYICDTADDGKGVLKIMGPGDARPRDYVLYTGQALIDHPRGICHDGKGLVMFVNAFQKQVMWTPIW